MTTRAIERLKDLFFLIARVRRPLLTGWLTRRPGLVEWHLRNGGRFVIRGRTADMLAIREVILRRTYPWPRRDLEIVVDIGAHVGSFTARTAPIAKRVLAFEPAQDNYELLSNYCRSPRNNIEVHQLAVTSDGRDVDLFLHPGNSGEHSIFKHDVPEPVVQRVRSVSSTALLEMVGGTIDLLKVDVEGAEHEILTARLLDRTNEIIAEVNEIGSESRPRLLALLEEHGFIIREMTSLVVHGARSQT